MCVRSIAASRRRLRRSPDKPFLLLVSGREMIESWGLVLSASARALSDAFWPGPLTLILPKTDAIAAEVTAGLPSVGLRVPDHPLALELLAGE